MKRLAAGSQVKYPQHLLREGCTRTLCGMPATGLSEIDEEDPRRPACLTCVRVAAVMAHEHIGESA